MVLGFKKNKKFIPTGIYSKIVKNRNTKSDDTLPKTENQFTKGGRKFFTEKIQEFSENEEIKKQKNMINDSDKNKIRDILMDQNIKDTDLTKIIEGTNDPFLRLENLKDFKKNNKHILSKLTNKKLDNSIKLTKKQIDKRIKDDKQEQKYSNDLLEQEQKEEKEKNEHNKKEIKEKNEHNKKESENEKYKRQGESLVEQGKGIHVDKKTKRQKEKEHIEKLKALVKNNSEADVAAVLEYM